MQGHADQRGTVLERGQARLGLLRDPGAPAPGGDGGGLSAPERSCVACRTRQLKGQLIRVVRAPSGEVRVDSTGRAEGRGGYVCRRAACVEAASGKGVLGRALRATLASGDLATLHREMEREIT